MSYDIFQYSHQFKKDKYFSQDEVVRMKTAHLTGVNCHY